MCDGELSPLPPLFFARRLDDGSLRMYYVGQGPDGSTAVGVARKGAPRGPEWAREQASITFASE
jgi:hypothetical protein